MTVARRALPLLRSFALLLLVAAATNAVLFGFDSAYAGWIPERSDVLQANYSALNTWRIEVVEASLRDVPPALRPPIGVIVGLSSVGYGVNLDALQAGKHDEIRYMLLANVGADIERVFDTATRVADGSLQPRRIIFGIHPQLLVNEPRSPGAPPGEFSRARAAGEFLNGWVWAVRHRGDSAAHIDTLRHRFARRLGRSTENHRILERQHLSAMADPWRPPFPPLHVRTGPEWEKNAREILAGLEHRRKFEPGAYARFGPKRSRELIELIRKFQAAGTEVAVVLMPEHSRLREAIPREAEEILFASLRSAFGPDELPLLDARAAMPDERFGDLAHLDGRGSREFSRRLAHWLEEQFPETPAPIARS